jgi:GNAT superfamily N-acetyltransferase
MSTAPTPATGALEIRAANKGDVLGITALLGELGFDLAPEVVAQRLERLAAAGELVLLGTRAGRAVAMITVHVTPVIHRPTYVGRLTAVIVTESERRSGVGRAMVAEAERILADKGCAIIELTSNKKLTGAHVFYERLGYEATSYRFQKNVTPRI